jgi:hypothetical protein
MLRHALATIAYRGSKALRGAPPSFAAFRAADGTRTPLAILAHIGDLLEWGLSLAEGQQRWTEASPASWDDEAARFHDRLARFDAFLASDTPLGCPAEQLFQGPVADALAHIGQIAMLRRMAGAPVRGENYARAEIVAGRLGPEQAGPRREFD